jgi:hemoglobin-like flavoprotein
MAVFATAIANLDRLDEILPRVRELGRRHVAFGVKDTDYDTGAVALMQTLQAAFGEAFTPAIRDAWTACYGAIVGEMKAGAAVERERVASPALVD